MPTFLDDLEVVDRSTIEQSGPLYVMSQWHNGDPKMAATGGVSHTGGVVIERKYVSDSVKPALGWSNAKVTFESGKTVPVLASQKPRLAVIRTRFRWFVVYNGVTSYYPRNAYKADTGMRGHVQALCGIHGYDFPVVVTFKGKASQHFELLLREFTQKITDAAAKVANKTKGEAFPRFAFYLRVAPGPHQKVGQKGQESIVTLPTLELPDALEADYLNKVYVGREALLNMQAEYKRSEEWASAWGKAGAEESAEQPADDTEPTQTAEQLVGYDENL